ncbi:unnamed protein product [Medioppia subpectinata]|uniref:Uncharacterized protein n=1 Tax=Medioppia subpectinata TaxID=1979941 RepID=A0A7R9LK37_9ACAR|nr:unnamed protein product [Medioppia subpectinata]CAG2119510.1 unnamed protein product [Medioppia subpectinata]
MDQTMIEHCVDHRCADTGTTTAIVTCAVCPPQSLTTNTSTNTKGILKYNKSPNSHTIGSTTAATMGRVKCPQKCCVSCRYVTNPRVPELRYDSIGIDREEPDITHEYSHT